MYKYFSCLNCRTQIALTHARTWKNNWSFGCRCSCGQNFAFNEWEED